MSCERRCVFWARWRLAFVSFEAMGTRPDSVDCKDEIIDFLRIRPHPVCNSFIAAERICLRCR